jgi:hypothetical protein
MGLNVSLSIWTLALSVSERLEGGGSKQTPTQWVPWVPGLFPGVKNPGRVGETPPPSRAEVKESVALYLYCPSVPSWQVIG